MSKRPRRAKRNKQEEGDGWVATSPPKGEPTLQETIGLIRQNLTVAFSPDASARFSLEDYKQALASAEDPTADEVRCWLIDNFPKNEIINERRCPMIVDAWIALSLAQRALASGNEAQARSHVIKASDALARANADFEQHWKGEVSHRRAAAGGTATARQFHAAQKEAARLIREKCTRLSFISEDLVVRTILPSFEGFLSASKILLKRDAHTLVSEWIAGNPIVRDAYREIQTNAINASG